MGFDWDNITIVVVVVVVVSNSVWRCILYRVFA